ncbi:MAG: hypothetical protein V4591_04400, partial [Bdellovibrionota bacterium]
MKNLFSGNIGIGAYTNSFGYFSRNFIRSNEKNLDRHKEHAEKNPNGTTARITAIVASNEFIKKIEELNCVKPKEDVTAARLIKKLNAAKNSGEVIDVEFLKELQSKYENKTRKSYCCLPIYSEKAKKEDDALKKLLDEVIQHSTSLSPKPNSHTPTTYNDMLQKIGGEDKCPQSIKEIFKNKKLHIPSVHTDNRPANGIFKINDDYHIYEDWAKEHSPSDPHLIHIIKLSDNEWI